MPRLESDTTRDSAFATGKIKSYRCWSVNIRFGRASGQSGMRSMAVIVVLKI